MVDNEESLELCKGKLLCLNENLLKKFETTKEKWKHEKNWPFAALRWNFIEYELAAYNEKGNDFSHWLKTFQTEVNCALNTIRFENPNQPIVFMQ